MCTPRKRLGTTVKFDPASARMLGHRQYGAPSYRISNEIDALAFRRVTLPPSGSSQVGLQFLTEEVRVPIPLAGPTFDDGAKQYLGTLESFWFHDLQVAVDGGANYLAALGLVSYTEVIGGLVLGTLGDPQDGGVSKRIRAAWRRMGPAYAALADDSSGYPDRVRNGLAHTYFMKVESTVAMHRHPLGAAPSGIFEDSERLVFVVVPYLRAFKAMFDDYRVELLQARSTGLRGSFSRALGPTWHWAALTSVTLPSSTGTAATD